MKHRDNAGHDALRPGPISWVWLASRWVEALYNSSKQAGSYRFVSEPNPSETTSGGALGRIVGKAKAAVGSVLGNDDLKREGHLQGAAADAEVVAARATTSPRAPVVEWASLQTRCSGDGDG